jgi:hypothetical protein
MPTASLTPNAFFNLALKALCLKNKATREEQDNAVLTPGTRSFAVVQEQEVKQATSGLIHD